MKTHTKYKVCERHLIDIKLEVALCPYCGEELQYVRTLYYDKATNMIMGMQHMCPECSKVTVLPVKYPRKVEIYSDDGEIVEYVNYTEDDLTYEGVQVCTRIQ